VSAPGGRDLGAPRGPGAGRPRVGISACLLGQSVRHDGGHKRDDDLLRTLGPHVEWVPVCPEVETGMPTPRPPIHLVGDAAAPRLVGVADGRDHSEAMEAWAASRLDALGGEGLDGFVLKERSPSCGLLGVEVHDASGAATGVARGFFAARLLRRFPGLPVEEEGRLRDPRVRERFLGRVLAQARRRAP
jgi:uncharacterized protein YbbK (DUF523 family)